MSAAEFSGVSEFAVGSVKGVRSFAVDGLGRLTGVTYTKVWRPGENTAECMIPKDNDFANEMQRVVAQLTRLNAQSWLLGGPTPTVVPVHPQPPTASVPGKPVVHSMASCSCGFYAYYDGSDDYNASGRITAVVEGYGETLIGTRGFRAAKARILALRLSDDVPLPVANRIRRNYPDVPTFGEFNDMLRAFPADEALSPSPESDPTFWDRKS